MDINQFIVSFAGCFDETEANAFSMDLRFKDLEEWSSLSALSIIAMCKKKYGIKITGIEIREAETILDLYNIVSERVV